VDREEFDENFCCIAAPVFDAHGRFVAALGASMTANVFDADRDELAPIVVDVARHAAGRVASTEPPAHVGETRRHRLGAKNLQAHAKTAHFLSGATPAA
jgi:transcriptional regulator of acetoin/glycerol metabolism